MLIVISPAKTMQEEMPISGLKLSKPAFQKEAGTLIKLLQGTSLSDLGSLLKVSSKLAQLNYERFQSWYPESKDIAAILSYQGDVYKGLQAELFSIEDLNYANDHLRMISGLYGYVKPLDMIQPYRLEMGTKMSGDGFSDLYDFWSEKLNKLLKKEIGTMKSPYLLNLASKEYSRVVDMKKLNCPVISPSFLDYGNGKYRMLSFFAKRARGLMARWVLQNRIENIDDLKEFFEEGYSYNDRLSKENEPVFTRDKKI